MFLGVNSDLDRAHAASAQPPGWRSWWDGGTAGPIAKRYGVVVYPTLLIIGPDGRIVERIEKTQFDESLCDYLETRLRDLLAELF